MIAFHISLADFSLPGCNTLALLSYICKTVKVILSKDSWKVLRFDCGMGLGAGERERANEIIQQTSEHSLFEEGQPSSPRPHHFPSVSWCTITTNSWINGCLRMHRSGFKVLGGPFLSRNGFAPLKHNHNFCLTERGDTSLQCKVGNCWC